MRSSTFERWPYPGATSKAASDGSIHGSVRGKLEANTPSLGRLAHLLQRRYDRAPERSFVVLMAEPPRGRLYDTDDLETQPIPVMRAM